MIAQATTIKFFQLFFSEFRKLLPSHILNVFLGVLFTFSFVRAAVTPQRLTIII